MFASGVCGLFLLHGDLHVAYVYRFRMVLFPMLMFGEWLSEVFVFIVSEFVCCNLFVCCLLVCVGFSACALVVGIG